MLLAMGRRELLFGYRAGLFAQPTSHLMADKLLYTQVEIEVGRCYLPKLLVNIGSLTLL